MGSRLTDASANAKTEGDRRGHWSCLMVAGPAVPAPHLALGATVIVIGRNQLTPRTPRTVRPSS